MKKTILPGILALCLLVSCGHKKSSRKESDNYPTIELKTTSRTLERDFPATLQGIQTVEIRPQIDGLLTNIYIHEGDAVKEGQVIFEIDPAKYKASYEIANANVASAEAAVATAKLVMEGNSELYKEKVISDFELNTAKNDYASALAKLKLAKAERDKAATDLSYTRVKSPVNGVASMIPYRVGALVNPNISEPLVTVSDDAGVYAYFSMSENDMINMLEKYGSTNSALANLPEVELRLSNGDIYPQKGKIDAISGTVNTTTGAVSMRAIFPNKNGLLRDGSTGSVILPNALRDCLVVPKEATFELQDKTFVYRAIDGKAVSTEIKVLQQSNTKEYVVLEGLKEGDIIISEGAGLIKEGASVNSQQQKETAGK